MANLPALDPLSLPPPPIPPPAPRYGGWFFYELQYIVLSGLCLVAHIVLLGDPFAFLVLHLCTLLASRAVLFSWTTLNFPLALILLVLDAIFATGVR